MKQKEIRTIPMEQYNKIKTRLGQIQQKMPKKEKVKNNVHKNPPQYV